MNRFEQELAVYKRALTDASWYRAFITKDPLYPFQFKIISLLQKEMLKPQGGMFTIRLPRQSGKNEISAFLQKWAMLAFQKRGGIYIRTAPTYRPQIVNSKLRLESSFKNDPLFKTKPRPREGYIYEFGTVQVKFLSSQKQSNVVGDTASIALDIDEAHTVDQHKFYEDFYPMSSSKGVPIFLFGPAAVKADLLYETRIANDAHGESWRNFQYTAYDVMRYNPAYEVTFNQAVRALGEDHPIIRTQFLMEDVDGAGMFLSQFHVESISAGDHPRLDAPRDGCTYYSCIDIAGEDEYEVDLADAVSGRRDSTVHVIFEIDKNNKVMGLPLCRIVKFYVYIGKKLQTSAEGILGQQELLLQQLKLWRVRKCVVDARGIGEAVASYLFDRHKGIIKYKAGLDSVSHDCYGLLAMLNNERLKLYRNDGSVEYKEFQKQMRWTSREIVNGDKLKLLKLSENKHIDMVKACTYLYQMVEKESSFFNARYF